MECLKIKINHVISKCTYSEQGVTVQHFDFILAQNKL